jgi:hypothetical protein
MSFWDTSALAKLYVEESDSAFYEALADAETSIHISRIALFEAYVVFRRAEFARRISSGEAVTLFSELQRDVDAGLVVIHEFESLEEQFQHVMNRCLAAEPPIFLRTLDALHLATAIVAEELSLVTADARQLAAAKLLGRTVLSA